MLTGVFDPAAVRALEGWYDHHVDGFVRPLTDISLASEGRSNVTAVLTDAAGTPTVLRMPPPGTHHASAHDVGREALIMRALWESEVPVPKVIDTCDNRDVLGAPFFVMEFVPGRVLDTAEDAGPIEIMERRSIAEDLARQLGALHRVHPAEVGLDRLGRTSGFVDRQLSRFLERWCSDDEAKLTRRFQRVHELLVASRPGEPPTSRIVHGDYRLGNVIVDGPRVVAVLDWELTTLGDPRADVAYLLNNWVDADEAADGPITSPTAAGGFGGRSELYESYCAALGERPDEETIRFFRALAYWRLASIRSGVAQRLANATDEATRAKVEQSRASLPLLLDAALGLLEGPNFTLREGAVTNAI